MYSTYETAYGAGSAQMMDRNLGAIYKEDGPLCAVVPCVAVPVGAEGSLPWGDVVYDADSNPYNYLSEWTAVRRRFAGAVRRLYGQHVVRHGAPRHLYRHHFGLLLRLVLGRGPGNDCGLPQQFAVGESERHDRRTGDDQDPVRSLPAGVEGPASVRLQRLHADGATARCRAVRRRFRVRLSRAVTASTTVRRRPTIRVWGYRYDEYGAFFFSPSGYYWTSSPAPSDSFGAWTFGLTSATVYECFSDPRGFGLPVRCQRGVIPFRRAAWNHSTPLAMF